MNIQGIQPSIMAPLQAQSASTPKAASQHEWNDGSGSTSSTKRTSTASLQETFLNLLVTELQNQDPTSPVDPTQMVGQLVLLNQLDQLISINSTLSIWCRPHRALQAQAQAAGRGHPAPPGQNQPRRSRPPINSSQTQPATASIPSSSDLMNLYGSFGAPAQTSNLTTTGGR